MFDRCDQPQGGHSVSPKMTTVNVFASHVLQNEQLNIRQNIQNCILKCIVNLNKKIGLLWWYQRCDLQGVFCVYSGVQSVSCWVFCVYNGVQRVFCWVICVYSGV